MLDQGLCSGVTNVPPNPHPPGSSEWGLFGTRLFAREAKHGGEKAPVIPTSPKLSESLERQKRRHRRRTRHVTTVVETGPVAIAKDAENWERWEGPSPGALGSDGVTLCLGASTFQSHGSMCLLFKPPLSDPLWPPRKQWGWVSQRWERQAQLPLESPIDAIWAPKFTRVRVAV